MAWTRRFLLFGSCLAILGLAAWQTPAEGPAKKGSSPEEAKADERARAVREKEETEARSAERAWMRRNLSPLLGAVGPESRDSEPGKPEPDKGPPQKVAPPAAGPSAESERLLFARTEKSIGLALDFLASAQERDGRWDSRRFGAKGRADLAQTSLAVLAFLGSGHTRRQGKYKESIRRALDWLGRYQRRDGAFTWTGEKPAEGLTHALAALVMCENYGMGEGLEDSAKQAVAYSLRVHLSELPGDRCGFGREPKSATPDLLTTTVFAMHLKSAHLAGLDVPPETFGKILAFVDDLRDKESQRYRLAKDVPPSERMAVAAAVCRVLSGGKKDEIRAAVEPLIPASALREARSEDADAVDTWLKTFAAFGCSDGTWKAWRANFQESLYRAQTEGKGPRDGAFVPSGEWKDAGRVCSTAAGVLALEIEYGLLPIHSRAGPFRRLEGAPQR